MKTEQEQIEEMAKQMCGDKDTFAKDLCSCCIAWDDCLEEAGNLYKAGYRKASEVIDELVKKIDAKIAELEKEEKKEDKNAETKTIPKSDVKPAMTTPKDSAQDNIIKEDKKNTSVKSSTTDLVLDDEEDDDDFFDDFFDN